MGTNASILAGKCGEILTQWENRLMRSSRSPGIRSAEGHQNGDIGELSLPPPKQRHLIG